MTKDLEVRVVLNDGKKQLHNPNSIHYENGKTYFIYASKEFLDNPLAKLNLGAQIGNVFKNSKKAGFKVSEVVVRYQVP